MSDQYNGGPAFPLRIENNDKTDVVFFDEVIKPETFCQFGGMTLRDYFAAKASDADVMDIMIRFLISPAISDGGDIGYLVVSAGRSYSITRQQARYIHADAMLKERSK